METGLDLTKASRETLLAVIAELQDTNAGLRQRVESLEARLSAAGPRGGMPGHKPAARRKKMPEQEKKPRRKRPHGFARPQMKATRRVVHAPESCPECHTTLSGGWVQRTREVIELPAAPVEVTEHVFIARTCPLCRKRRLPQDPPQGLAAGRQRLGANLVSLIAALRERGPAARKDHPMVSANGASVETEPWGHRPCRPSGCQASRTGSGRDSGAHP